MAEPVTPQQEFPPEIARLLKLFGDKLSRDTVSEKYANNAAFETSVWDLKIIFGQLQQRTGTEVSWHTAVTMPWLQAKLLDYYLRLNIAFHEKDHGPLRIPTAIKPIVPTPTEEELKDSPSLMELTEIYKKIHAEMFGQD